MIRFTHTVAALALAALATAPSADAQRRAAADADVPGALILAAPVADRAEQVSDQDVPDAPKPTPQILGTTKDASDQDDPNAGLVAQLGDPFADLADPLADGRDGAARTQASPVVSGTPTLDNGRNGAITSARQAGAAPAPTVLDNGRATAGVANAPSAPAAPSKTGATPVAGVALSASRPNPVREAAQVSFTLARAADVTLTLFDVRGREVAALFAARAEAGTHPVTIDVSGLAPGAYIYVLDADGTRVGRQLQVAR